MAKVLFQSTNPRTFRATLVGYVYEIAQKHEVVLLTNQLDKYTESTLQDKSVFPGLQNVVVFESSFGGNIFLKNYRLKKIIQKTIQEYQPDIAVAPSDMWPSEMYFLRLAKKAGATTVAMQSGFKIAEHKRMFAWAQLMQSYGKMPGFIPIVVSKSFVWVKKAVGYSLYHWVLPVVVGEIPFFGKTSFVFWHESSGLRDADYSAVFSKRDYAIGIADGVAPEKIVVIGHPLEHEGTKKFFQETYFSEHKEAESEKTATIMWSDENIGFDENDQAVVPAEKIRQSKIAIVQHISEILADWNIFIKPHPATKETSAVRKFLGEVPKNVSVVNPSEPADKYIEMSKVIVGMPLPSTTLFTAQKQYPHKIILSLNINHEFLGDSYKDFEGIDYIDTEEKFISVLDSIREGTYRKKQALSLSFDFASAKELIDYLYEKRIS